MDTKVPESVSSNDEPVVIAFVNYHSGGKTGQQIATELTRLLGQDRVFNLAEGGPRPGLEKWRHVPNLRVVACGGDGTVNWVLASIHQLGMVETASAGIIPLGTGNDASRAFGWGFKFPGVSGIAKNVKKMKTSPVVPFDRWHVAISHPRPLSAVTVDQYPPSIRQIKKLPPFSYNAILQAFTNADNTNISNNTDKKSNNTDVELDNFKAATQNLLVGSPRPIEMKDQKEAVIMSDLSSVLPMNTSTIPNDKIVKFIPEQDVPDTVDLFGTEWNNYLSFGVDAQIEWGFHNCRENYRGCFCCRICNMAWMGCYGLCAFCCCQALTLDITVEVRDREGKWSTLTIPNNVRAIVLLNLPTYAAGRDIWGKPTSKYVGSDPSTSDGLVEVIGVVSTFHLIRMTMECSKGLRLAQACEVKVHLNSPRIYVQMDGEPWLDEPSTYHVRPLRQLQMLRNNSEN